MRIQEIKKPFGYPYMLYRVNVGADTKYVAAATESQAIRLTKTEQATALPVSVKALIDDFGHQKTHKLLASLGKRWVCKEGKVFYKELAC